jgi:hypothetical protein
MMTGSGAVRGFDFSSLAEDGGRFSIAVLASFTRIFCLVFSFLYLRFTKLSVRQLHLVL